MSVLAGYVSQKLKSFVISIVYGESVDIGRFSQKGLGARAPRRCNAVQARAVARYHGSARLSHCSRCPAYCNAKRGPMGHPVRLSGSDQQHIIAGFPRPLPVVAGSRQLAGSCLPEILIHATRLY